MALRAVDGLRGELLESTPSRRGLLRPRRGAKRHSFEATVVLRRGDKVAQSVVDNATLRGVSSSSCAACVAVPAAVVGSTSLAVRVDVCSKGR